MAADVAGPRTIFLLLVAGLTLFGFVMIYSASAPTAVAEGQSATSYLTDQILFAVIGVAAAFAAARLPYHIWLSRAVYVVWALGFVLVVLTVPMGAAMYGAQRWLVLGPISLQPSEFMKIALVLVCAKLLSDLRAGAIDTQSLIFQVVVLVVIPTAVIYTTQSDLGTTMIIFVGVLSVMWMGEIDWKIVALVIFVGALFAVLSTVATPYRSNRMLYLDPWNDGQNGFGNGYQIIHSYYAFAQGGIFGTGIGNSTEKYLYLPESETDFIYSIIGEELGLIGAVLVMIAFLVLLWAGLRIARSAVDDFGCMVAGALIIMIVFQAFLNMGSAMGVLPTTGKPLPFISSGGSSLIATFIMVGLILSVSDTTVSTSLSGGDSHDIYEQRRENLRVVRSVDEGASASSSNARASRGSGGFARGRRGNSRR